MALPNFTEAMLRTLTAAFSPQIAEAVGEVLKVAQAYEARMARLEAMVELLVMRGASNGPDQAAITDASVNPDLHG
jgi:hypothetical protein